MQLALPDGRSLDLQRPCIVGVLNVTPDSFSDGGSYPAPGDAADAAMRMIQQGADVIDIGAESTRPGSQRIDADEQVRRAIPVIEIIMQQARDGDHPVPVISIDTTLAAVAVAAMRAGATIINDVSAGRDDPAMFKLAADRDAPMILMHMQNDPATMQDDPHYDDVVTEVRDFLVARAEAAIDAGVDRKAVVIDPGIGFGKTTGHNLSLLAHLDVFAGTGYPVMLGASRKRFIGQITGQQDPSGRMAGTCATTALGVAAGVAMFRVHDVAANRQAADVAAAVVESRAGAK